MKKIYILGGHGNGLVIAAAISRKYKDAEIEFLNDVDEIGIGIGKYKKIYVTGKTKEISERLYEKDTHVISAYAGFSNPLKSLKKLEELDVPNEKWLKFVDETAIVPSEFCNIMKDTFIGPLAQLSPNVEIGAHCSLFGNSFIGHDTDIGDFCHIASNGVVGSLVHIGKGVHIGTNSCIRENINIGDYSVIGAGAVVVNDVPANAIVVGNPARILKYRIF